MADDADDGEAILLSDDAAVVMAEAEDTTDAAAIIMTTSKLQPHSIMSHRGINNVNGTACHTSSALQLIFHCFPLLREALLKLAPVCAEFYMMGQRKRSSRSANKGAEIVQNEFVYQLSWFFYLLAYDEDVLEVSKASLADELYESSSAVAAAAGADAEVLEANAKGTIEESKSSEENDAKDDAICEEAAAFIPHETSDNNILLSDQAAIEHLLAESKHFGSFPLATVRNRYLKRSSERIDNDPKAERVQLAERNPGVPNQRIHGL